MRFRVEERVRLLKKQTSHRGDKVCVKCAHNFPVYRNPQSSLEKKCAPFLSCCFLGQRLNLLSCEYR